MEEWRKWKGNGYVEINAINAMLPTYMLLMLCDYCVLDKVVLYD